MWKIIEKFDSPGLAPAPISLHNNFNLLTMLDFSEQAVNKNNKNGKKLILF